MTSPALTVAEAPCGCSLTFPFADLVDVTDAVSRARTTCGHGREWRLTVTLMPEPSGAYLADNVEVAS